MLTFKLSDIQADAILNMRLRNLRKLEEMQIRAEDKDLREERKKVKSLLGSDKINGKRWPPRSRRCATFGPKTALGKEAHSVTEARAR